MIAFQQASVLWALWLLAIPIVIHLFNFRRYKKIIFTKVDFLTQIEQSSQTGNVLKKRLILLSRLLALSALILAFAQPYIPLKSINPRKGQTSVSIVLDNSYSMNLPGTEGPLLEGAKNRARAIVNASDRSSQFNIITADLNAEYLHFTNQATCLQWIDAIKITENSFPLKQLLSVQANSLKPYGNNGVAYCISDFQSAQTQNLMATESSIWIKVNGSNSSNFAIDTVALSNPIIQANQAIELTIGVSNYSNENSQDLPIELWVDGKPKGVASATVNRFTKANTNLQFVVETGGIHYCELRLPGDQMPTDDRLYFTLNLNQTYSVASIEQSNSPNNIRALFSNNPGFDFKVYSSNSIPYQSFADHDLILLNQLDKIETGFLSELLRYMASGGSIMVFPQPNQPYGGYKALLNSLGSDVKEAAVINPQLTLDIAKEHPLFQGIFNQTTQSKQWPQVQRYFAFNSQAARPILQLSDKTVVFADFKQGKGHCYVSALPLDNSFSELPNHALIVPICLRAAMLAAYQLPLYYQCNTLANIETGLPFQAEQSLILQHPNYQMMPEVINNNGQLCLNTNGEIKTAGSYNLSTKQADTKLMALAFNFDRSESDTRALSDQAFDELTERLGVKSYLGSAEALQAQLSKLENGKPLWKWLILFSLLCLLIEILLIRFFKNHVKLSA